MAGDVVRINVGIEVSYIAGSAREYEAEVPRAEWDAMDAEGREKYLQGLAQDEVDNYVSAWATVIGEEVPGDGE